MTTNEKGLLNGIPVSLDKRQIDIDTCTKYGYKLGKLGNTIVEIADYVADNKVVGQKIRAPNKQFHCRGQMSTAHLWGQHLWRDGGKRIM